MSGNDLLPCPFCGGEADTHAMPDGTHVQCFDCEANSAMFDGSRFGKGRDPEFACDDAIEAWNKRAPDPHVKTLRDEIAMAALAAMGAWVPAGANGYAVALSLVKSTKARWAYDMADAMMEARKVQS